MLQKVVNSTHIYILFTTSYIYVVQFHNRNIDIITDYY